MKKTVKKLDSKEIIRFIITGFLAAIIDFSFCALITFLLQKAGMKEESILCIAISTAVGFIISIIFNYLLSIKWVYQNFDRNKMKEHQTRHAVIFVGLSAIGLFIGVGVMALLKYIFIAGANINIDSWQMIDVSFGEWIKRTLVSVAFWLYGVSFVIKTIIVLVYNYISRKKILFVDQKSR